MKRVILVVAAMAGLTAVSVAAFATAGAGAVPYQPTLEIRFAEVGCHTWSLNGRPAAVEQNLRLQVGQSITVVNRDICTHTLVETSGAPLTMSAVPAASPTRHVQVPSFTDNQPVVPAGSTAAVGSMAFGSGVLTTFTQPGRYELITHEGDSLFGAWPTVGPDNQLALHVQVVANRNFPLD